MLIKNTFNTFTISNRHFCALISGFENIIKYAIRLTSTMLKYQKSQRLGTQFSLQILQINADPASQELNRLKNEWDGGQGNIGTLDYNYSPELIKLVIWNVE